MEKLYTVVIFHEKSTALLLVMEKSDNKNKNKDIKQKQKATEEVSILWMLDISLLSSSSHAFNFSV